MNLLTFFGKLLFFYFRALFRIFSLVSVIVLALKISLLSALARFRPEMRKNRNSRKLDADWSMMGLNEKTTRPIYYTFFYNPPPGCNVFYNVTCNVSPGGGKSGLSISAAIKGFHKTESQKSQLRQERHK